MTLLEQARQAQSRAYCPYSQYPVGCALEAADGAVFTGCNIENASYGATVCAERVALFEAVKLGHRNFRRLVICTNATSPAPPCGLCRQALAEFCSPDLAIILVGAHDSRIEFRFGDLFPHPFSPASLL
jgi:cytidine deaminase